MRFIFAIFLLVLANTQSQLLPEGQNVKYLYSALVQNTIQEPASVVSQYFISANLNLNTFKNYTRLSFENVKFSLYNGKVKNIKTSNYHKGNSSFNTPFLIKHDFSGKIHSVLTEKTDEKWAADMKTSIATLFQFDITKVNLKDSSGHSTEAMESTPFGNCLVNYMYKANSSDLTLEKWHSLSSCKEYETKANLIEDNNYYKCKMSFQDSLNADNEKLYKFKVRDEGLLLTNIESSNRITFSYFNAKAEVQITQIRQELSMISESSSDKNNVDKTDVHLDKYHEHLAENFHAESSSFQFFSDWDEQDIEYVAKQIMTQLKGIDDNARKYLLTDVNKYDSYSVSSLLSYLRPLSTEHLSLVHSELKKLKMEEEIESVFYKILSFIGTHDSVEFVLSLVRDKTFDEEVAATMVQELPFNIRKPDVKILDKFHYLFDKVSNNNIKYVDLLSFATILARVSQNDPSEIEKTRRLIDKFIINLDKSLPGQDYKKKMVLISCLQNILSVPHIHTYRVSKFLEKILTKGVEINEEFRDNVIASVILAGKRVHSQDNKVLQSVYLPILRDQTYSSFLIQTAAIDVLMMSPSMHIQTMLLWIMRNRVKDEIYNYYYSSVLALTEAKDPCLHVLARNARKISQFLKKRELGAYDTSMMVDYADYYDEKYGFGASHKLSFLNGVQNVRTISIEYKKYVTSLFSTTTTIYMRSNGTSYNLYSPMSMATQSMDVEMFLVRDGCVTDIMALDGKTMESFVKDFGSNSLNDMLKDKYLEYLESYFIDMIQTDFIVPTDIGLPVRAFVEVPKLHRLEYNITFETGKLALKVNWNENSEQIFGMTSYAPLADVWHGSRRVYNIRGALGVDLEVQDQTPIGIKLYNPLNREPGAYGYQTFVKSEVFIFEGSDDGMFKKSCPECNNVEVAQRSKDNLSKINVWSYTNEFTDTQHELVIFDCDREITKDTINLEKHKFMEGILSSKGNSRSSEMMKIRHLWALAVSSPEPGTCGTAYYIRPRDGVSNEDWFSSISIGADRSSFSKFDLNFTVDFKHEQRQLEMLTDYQSYSMEVSRKVNSKDKSNPDLPGHRMCISSKKSNPEVDDNLVIYVEIKEEDFNNDQIGCIKNDTNIVLSMKRDDKDVNIFHYDFKWENLQQHMSDFALKVGDRFREFLSQNFARIYGKANNKSKDELKVTLVPKYNENKLDVIVESPYESFGYFNITSIPLSFSFRPYWHEVVIFNGQKQELLRKKISENTVQPTLDDCEWETLYESNQLGSKGIIELPEINANVTILLSTIEEESGKTIDMRLDILYENGDSEEIQVIQKGRDIRILYNGDLQESGLQYGSFGKGMIKYKINDDKEVEIYVNRSKRLSYSKNAIKYKHC